MNLACYSCSLTPSLASCAYPCISEEVGSAGARSAASMPVERAPQGIATQVILRRQPLRSRHLELQHLEDPGAAPDEQPAVFRSNTACLEGAFFFLRCSGAPDFNRPSDLGVVGPCPNVGGQSPDQIRNFTRLSIPADQQIHFRKFRRISCMKTVLLGEVYLSPFYLIENLYYSFSSHVGDQVGELPPCHVGWYLDGTLQGHRTGVQALFHTDYGDAGLVFAVHYRPFDRGGTPILRQERGVDVPGALLGRKEGVGAKDLAVGGNDEGVVARDLVGYLRYAGGLAQR